MSPNHSPHRQRAQAKLKHIEAVLFDLDGTLLDTAPDFHRIVNQLQADRGLSATSYDITQRSVSNGAMALLRASFDINPDSDEFKQLHIEMLNLYEANLATETKLYEGMEGLLNWLEAQQLPWGIVTNKPKRFTYPLLDQLHLHHRCATVICPDHVNHQKPHPEPLLLACNQIKCDPAKTIYVGDHKRDIEAGRHANMKTIAALYGYIEENAQPDTWQATFKAKSVDDITQWLQSQI
jgi:phosphoglycolate phosphatase